MAIPKEGKAPFIVEFIPGAGYLIKKMNCNETIHTIGGMALEFIVGIAIILIMFFSKIVEKRLKSIEDQNERIIEILEDIRDK